MRQDAVWIEAEAWTGLFEALGRGDLPCGPWEALIMSEGDRILQDDPASPEPPPGAWLVLVQAPPGKNKAPGGTGAAERMCFVD